MIGSYCWVLVGSKEVLRQDESLNCRCCKHLPGSWWALACPMSWEAGLPRDAAGRSMLEAYVSR